MRLKRTMLLIFVFFSFFSPFSSVLIASSSYFYQSLEAASDLPESYIIQDVPWVGQPARYCCSFGCLAMLINYYGVNTTIEEVLHSSGIGYSFAYIRFLTTRNPMAGAGVCQFPLNTLSTLSLYGLKTDPKSYLDPYIKGSNAISDENWENYWSNVKGHIAEDAPILTSVDPFSIPYYREKLNITNTETHGGHAIIVIGYNESNQTVCYNDPGPGIWDEEENGSYVFISKQLFRDAVENTTGSRYIVGLITDDPNNEALSKEERFNISHKRNIQRMKGFIGAYAGFNFPIKFPYLGINGLKIFKRDFQPGLTHRVIMVNAFSKMEKIQVEHFFIFMKLEKQDISRFLLENEELSPVCRQNGLLLKKESECWKNLTDLALQLNEISQNNNLLKSLSLTSHITKEMSIILGEIIDIHEEIISISN